MLETLPRELTQNPLKKIWMPCRTGHIAQRRGKVQPASAQRMMRLEVMQGVCSCLLPTTPYVKIPPNAVSLFSCLVRSRPGLFLDLSDESRYVTRHCRSLEWMRVIFFLFFLAVLHHDHRVWCFLTTLSHAHR